MTDTFSIPGYQILRQLGQGGTATVYLAVQNSFGREVALKIMSPLLNQDPTFAPRFVREARIVSQMHHASIVPVFDVGEHRHHHYLSMELLPGGDLRQRIVDGRCSPATALDVCQAISSALDLAHRKGFVHRDIKPQNILFREDGTPVLTDFGIARAIDVGTSLTAAGMFVGTPNYMSPEQVKGLELDGRSDLYSLGIVFYEMLTGTVPFRADSALSIALKHLSDPLPPLPAELAMYQPFLDQLTAKDKEHRFASSAEVMGALSIMGGLPGASSSTLVRPRAAEADKAFFIGARPEQSPVPSARKPTPAWVRWGGAAVVFVLIATAAAMIGRSTAPGRPTAVTSMSTAPLPTRVAPETLTPSSGFPPLRTNTTLPAETTSAAAPTASSVETPTIASVPVLVPAPSPAVAAESRERQLAVERRARDTEAANRRQKQIASMLADAQASVASGALVSPPRVNAADQYRAILQLQPQQSDAVAGLSRIADALVANAERERKAGDVDAALSSLSQARAINATHPRLAKLQGDLEERKVKLQRRAQENLEESSEHTAKARIYLDRQPVTLRNVAEANDHYDKAVELSATAPDLNGVRERILAGYAAAAQTELNASKPARALKVLEYARRRSMASPSLDQLEPQIKALLPAR